MRFRVNHDYIVENRLGTRLNIYISQLRSLPKVWLCNSTNCVLFTIQRLKAHTRLNTPTESSDDRNTLPVESFPSLHARQKGELRPIKRTKYFVV